MAEFQELMDFPPAPKLGCRWHAEPKSASQAEMRGQTLFFGKAKCGAATLRRTTPITRCTICGRSDFTSRT